MNKKLRVIYLAMILFVTSSFYSFAIDINTRVLREGYTGTDVVELQKDLIELGFYLGTSGADGYFGKYTLEAVKGIQSASNIIVDGVVGKTTKMKINEWLSKPKYGASTAHFNQVEFKCNHCGSLGGGIKTSLLLRLEALRVKLGNRAIRITSGYRCETYNSRIGGETNSYHSKRLAADIVVLGVLPSVVANNAETIFGDGGLGRYSSFTHVDVRGYRIRW